MAKNLCCKICGRFDYDDNGEYLICRACGEKRRKYPFPLKETLLSFLMSAMSLLFLVCASVSGKYIPRNKPYYSSNKNDIMTGRNEFDDFMNSIRHALVWITPIFWVLTIISVILTVKFVSALKQKKMYKL